MATVAAKVPEALAEAFRAKAEAQGRTSSEVLRELMQDYVAPPSDEWIEALLKLHSFAKKHRRKGPARRPKDIDPLTWAIDTMPP